MIDKIIEKLPIHIIPCQEASRLISLSMERSLSLKERFDLTMHLWVCSLCVTFSKQVGSLRHVMRRYTPRGEKQLPLESKIRIKKNLEHTNF